MIVGSVDGNRIWGKEFKKTSMLGVQWTSDSQNLLFAIKGGQVHLYDYEGNFMNKVSMWSGPGSEMGEIAALKFYLNRTSGKYLPLYTNLSGVFFVYLHLYAVLLREGNFMNKVNMWSGPGSEMGRSRTSWHAARCCPILSKSDQSFENYRRTKKEANQKS